MIKVCPNKLKRLEAQHQHYFENDSGGLDLLRQYTALPYRAKKEKAIFAYLEAHYMTVLTGDPQALAKIIADITALNGGIALRKGFQMKLQEVFNYSKFSTRGPGVHGNLWGGYLLAQELDLPVCPYCNRQYITVYRYKARKARSSRQSLDEGQTRGALDHFFEKSRYPYLAISLYNLIPSCKVCNSDFKLDKPMSLAGYLHPYVEGFEKQVRFTLKPTYPGADPDQPYDIDALLGSNDHFQLKLRYISPDPTFNERAERNAQLFKLEPLYNSHKDHVRELLQKKQHYTPDYIDYMLKASGKLFSSREEVVRMVTGNYPLEQEHHKRPLAKMLADLADELKLLDYF